MIGGLGRLIAGLLSAVLLLFAVATGTTARPVLAGGASSLSIYDYETSATATTRAPYTRHAAFRGYDGTRQLSPAHVAAPDSSFAAKSGSALVPRTSISRHAAEQMAERGITARQVEVAMRQGTRYFDRRNQTFSYVLEGGYASGRSLVVGANPFTGNVTTAIRQSRAFNPGVLLPDGTPRYVLAPR